jgi:hypothetical protein
MASRSARMAARSSQRLKIDAVGTVHIEAFAADRTAGTRFFRRLGTRWRHASVRWLGHRCRSRHGAGTGAWDSAAISLACASSESTRFLVLQHDESLHNVLELADVNRGHE